MKRTMRNSGGIAALFAAGVLALALGACAGAPAALPEAAPGPAKPSFQTVAAGAIEDRGNPLMNKVVAAHNKLQPGADEMVIYYVRADGDYASWGFWLWAIPGGDGSAVWDKSKDLGVAEGVGYLRFKKDGSTLGLKTLGADGLFGLIPRKDSGWDKDGDNDRILDAKVTNEWVIFEKDQKTYAYGPYVPTIDNARLASPRELIIDLSGRYGLPLEAGSGGFTVEAADGSSSVAVVDAVNALDPANRQDNYARKVSLRLGADAPLDAPLVVRHRAFLAPARVDAASLAAALAEKILPPEGYTLGPVYDAAGKKVEFRLWSPFASKAVVRLYKTSLAAKADYSLDLAKDAATGVWKGIFDAQDPDGLFYEYSLFFGSKENIVLDPYAKSMDAYKGAGAGRGAVLDPAKALPPGGWEGYEDVKLAKREDAIIYELSVRDFTISPEARTRARPGSYLAFAEKLDHLKALGVTHIQLMPVLNFMYNDETKTAFEGTGTANNNNYDWGYDPQSYFTPEGWYASDPADPYARVRELKTLVREIHRAGMGVLLDVVYNHTGNASVLDDVVPGYYYRRDARGALTSQSGCGNDVASERAMAGRLIRDSLYYLVDEYKVDGFRFDLMGLIDADTILKGRAAAAKLPGKDDILFEGEGWKMYRGPQLTVMDQNYMTRTDQVSVFNDEFRDILKAGGMNDRAKGFVTGKPVNTSMIFSELEGKPLLNYKADQPGDSMNYVSAHDNLTLPDNIAFNAGLKAEFPAERAEIAARLKLAEFLVLTGQPLAFLHGGDERGRSKPRLNSKSEVTGDYVSNSYDASDDINQYPWKVAPEYEASAAWVSGVIAIRRAEEAFRIGDAKAIETAMKQLPQEDKLSLGWTVDWKGSKFLLFVNANFDQTMKFEAGVPLAAAKVLVDRDGANPAGLSKPAGFKIDGQTLTLDPLTAVMLKL